MIECHKSSKLSACSACEEFWVMQWTDVSEEHVTPIFRVKEQTKQEISLKHIARRLICPSEMLVDSQQITQCYIPEDNILHDRHCENQKFFYTASREKSNEVRTLGGGAWNWTASSNPPSWNTDV
jgi:hypothetical protein